MFSPNTTYRTWALLALFGLLAVPAILAQQKPEQLGALIQRFRTEHAQFKQLLAQKN